MIGLDHRPIASLLAPHSPAPPTGFGGKGAVAPSVREGTEHVAQRTCLCPETEMQAKVNSNLDINQLIMRFGRKSKAGPIQPLVLPFPLTQGRLFFSASPSR